jgi:histone H3/H4
MENFEVYIKKVLKQVHPDNQISQSAVSLINFMINKIGNSIVQESNRLIHPTHYKNLSSHVDEKITIGSREIQTSTKLIVPGELVKHAVSQGTKAVIKFTSSSTQTSKSARAGLQFSVARCKVMIEKKSPRVSETAGVYLAGVLEYLTAEILELAGNACKDEHKKVITPHHVKNAVENDNEILILIFEQNILLPGTMNVKYPKSKKNIPPNFGMHAALYSSNVGGNF